MPVTSLSNSQKLNHSKFTITYAKDISSFSPFFQAKEVVQVVSD
jgi:hypothetical protein